jgi:hypothetical protein
MPSRSPIPPRRTPRAVGCLAFAGLALGLLAAAGPEGRGQQPPRRVKVKIQDANPVIQEVALPIEPQIRAQPAFVGSMAYGLNVDGKRLTFSQGSARTTLRIDGQILHPGVQQRPLGPGPRGKPRQGVTSTFVQNNVHITQVMEIVPGKPSAKPKPGQKRQMDTLLIRYLIENKDNRPHDVGVRVRIDTFCWTNDGCLFASPEKHPGKILNGVELKGKDVPDYLQILQNNDLKNPGWVAHFTFKIGRFDPPSRVICTSHGAGENGWDVNVIQAMGDSDAAFFWDPVKIPAGGKRELAFAHGQGIATSPENEGRVNLDLGGSFEPGKAFTVTAYVHDPVESQSLALNLPPGMELVRGKEIEPVPPPNESNSSIVQWRARVLRPGTFPLRVRSSNGVTYTKNITVSLADAP